MRKRVNLVGNTRPEGIARDPWIAASLDASGCFKVDQLSSNRHESMASVQRCVQFQRHDSRETSDSDHQLKTALRARLSAQVRRGMRRSFALNDLDRSVCRTAVLLRTGHSLICAEFRRFPWVVRGKTLKGLLGPCVALFSSALLCDFVVSGQSFVTSSIAAASARKGFQSLL